MIGQEQPQVLGKALGFYSPAYAISRPKSFVEGGNRKSPEAPEWLGKQQSQVLDENSWFLFSSRGCRDEKILWRRR